MNPPNKQWTIESLHPSQMADEDKEKLADMEGQFSKWDVDPKWANLLRYIFCLLYDFVRLITY